MTRDGLAGMGQSHLVRDTSFPTPGKNFLYPIFDPSRSLQLTDSGPSRLSCARQRRITHLGLLPTPFDPDCPQHKHFMEFLRVILRNQRARIGSSWTSRIAVGIRGGIGYAVRTGVFTQEDLGTV